MNINERLANEHANSTNTDLTQNERRLKMHVVSASAAFNVALRRAIHRPQVAPASLSANMKKRLRAAGQALTLAVQALLFAVSMWLLLAAPALLPAQQSSAPAPAALQASR